MTSGFSFFFNYFTKIQLGTRSLGPPGKIMFLPILVFVVLVAVVNTHTHTHIYISIYIYKYIYIYTQGKKKLCKWVYRYFSHIF